tara:strand:- start:11 stop:535 length:525 start_codon:yes stop_codon:yes gene_type:complete
MATKTKIKDSIKNLFIKELTDKKEVERLERVKTNANLREATIYTSKDQPQSKQFIDFLTNEGIKFIEKEQSEYVNEYNEFVATTNMGGFPSVIINNNFLVMRRDFQTPQQLVGAIQFLGNPEFKNTNSEKTVLEHLKTTNYNLMMRINQLSQQISPIITFVQNLEKQLAEEDSE